MPVKIRVIIKYLGHTQVFKYAGIFECDDVSGAESPQQERQMTFAGFMAAALNTTRRRVPLLRPYNDKPVHAPFTPSLNWMCLFKCNPFEWSFTNFRSNGCRANIVEKKQSTVCCWSHRRKRSGERGGNCLHPSWVLCTIHLELLKFLIGYRNIVEPT